VVARAFLDPHHGSRAVNRETMAFQDRPPRATDADFIRPHCFPAYRRYFMQATEVLMEEHTVIVRVLDSLDLAADRLESGKPVRPAFFLEAAEFIKGFADGCHHHKEEGLLFPALEAAGVPGEGGPVGMMLHEHDVGRGYTRAMREAAERLQDGDAAAQDAVLENARGYATLLRQHIQKENMILFRMADNFIQGPACDELTAAFERAGREEAGAGIQAKFRSIAEALEREARG
jgi:hemerythrin-like domain-containing protein